MKRAQKITFLVFGILTAFFVVVGGFFLLNILVSVSPITKLNDVEAPYTSYFFALYSLTNLLFLIALGIAAYRLFKKAPSGLTLLAWTLKAELVYVVSTSFLWFLPSPWGMSAGGATGIGNMGISPQFFIAYPITGIVVLWMLRMSNILTFDPKTD